MAIHIRLRSFHSRTWRHARVAAAHAQQPEHSGEGRDGRTPQKPRRVDDEGTFSASNRPRPDTSIMSIPSKCQIANIRRVIVPYGVSPGRIVPKGTSEILASGSHQGHFTNVRRCGVRGRYAQFITSFITEFHNLKIVMFLLIALGSYSHAQLTSGNTPTVILARDPGRTIDLSAFTGKTYLQVMESVDDGIFSKTHVDDNSPVTIAAAAQIVQIINQLDSKVGQRLFGLFQNGESDFSAIIAHIEGQSLSPQQIRSVLSPYITNLIDPSHANIALDSSATLALLASGSGTLVLINSNEYFYNVGYETPVVKSGRSFGAAPGRSLLDPSDKEYLTEMDDYLKGATPDEINSIYKAILEVLIKSDGSKLSGLSPPAQVMAADFVTIYTAELVRHVMMNLDVLKDPWEIDIAEVTLLTDYGAASGMVMKNGSLVPGTAADYYGQGASGGGIGDTRDDFTRLGKLITAFESEQHPDLIQAVVDLTPIQDAGILSAIGNDIFRRFVVFLNRIEFQDNVQSYPDALSKAMVQLLTQVRSDQSQITQYVQTH